MGVVRALLDTVISLDSWFCIGSYILHNNYLEIRQGRRCFLEGRRRFEDVVENFVRRVRCSACVI